MLLPWPVVCEKDIYKSFEVKEKSGSEFDR